MGKWTPTVLYVVVMVGVIVGVDLVFLRNNFSLRLMTNIGIALAFLLVYLKFFGRPWSP